MNLALAIGVVCRCAQGTVRRTAFLCSGLGVTLAALLMLSDSVYQRQPGLLGEAFPIVRLLAQFGRTGFLISAGLLFLAVFTSLAAVLCALDGETPVLAAVKPKDTPFLRAVRGHENAELVFIDEQNRDALLEKLLPHILRWNEA